MAFVAVNKPATGIQACAMLIFFKIPRLSEGCMGACMSDPYLAPAGQKKPSIISTISTIPTSIPTSATFATIYSLSFSPPWQARCRVSL